jgi:hypothetical protein
MKRKSRSGRIDAGAICDLYFFPMFPIWYSDWRVWPGSSDTVSERGDVREMRVFTI